MKSEIDEKEWKRLAAQGARLKTIRKSKGLSQSSLAEGLGLSTTAVQNWERGANDILYKHRDKLCYYLNCDFSEISGDKIGKTTNQADSETFNIDDINQAINASSPRTSAIIREFNDLIVRGIELSEQEESILKSILDSVKIRHKE